jgi:hypothetical protein
MWNESSSRHCCALIVRHLLIRPVNHLPVASRPRDATPPCAHCEGTGKNASFLHFAIVRFFLLRIAYGDGNSGFFLLINVTRLGSILTCKSDINSVEMSASTNEFTLCKWGTGPICSDDMSSSYCLFMTNMNCFLLKIVELKLTFS